MRGTLQIYKIYQSIVGAGKFSGQNATYFRLFGCNLTCLYCDRRQPKILPQVEYRSGDLEFCELIKFINTDLVVIMGGEPFLQERVHWFIQEVFEFFGDQRRIIL